MLASFSGVPTIEFFNTHFESVVSVLGMSEVWFGGWGSTMDAWTQGVPLVLVAKKSMTVTVEVLLWDGSVLSLTPQRYGCRKHVIPEPA